MKTLLIITASNDDASRVYVRKKIQKCEESNVKCQHGDLFDKVLSEEDFIRGVIDESYTKYLKTELMGMIQKANKHPDIGGILLQLPLADELKPYTKEFLASIDPKKDIDCLTPHNQGKIALGDNSFLPCTVQGVLDLMKSNTDDGNLRGQNVIIVGRSNLVGMPLTMACMNEGMIVQNFNSTADDYTIKGAVFELGEYYDNSPIHFISAIGVANYFNFYDKNSYYIDGDYRYADESSIGGCNWYTHKDCEKAAAEGKRVSMMRHESSDAIERLCIYDVGINRDENGKLCGDVRSSDAPVRYQSPVPGGVGPLTVKHVIENFKKLNKE